MDGSFQGDISATARNELIYRKHKYNTNNCWLKNCDGHRKDEQLNLRKYGLQSGDAPFQFQTWHRTQNGQACDWTNEERKNANFKNSQLCPKADQLKLAEQTDKLEDIAMDDKNNLVLIYDADEMRQLREAGIDIPSKIVV